jgi:cellobiose phosphorylase
MKKVVNTRWEFTDDIGSFEWKNPATLNQLHFPICNEAGMMSSVSPTMHGDATTGQHTFLRLPLVLSDLYNTRSARNFWVYKEGFGAYSLTGNSAKQNADVFTEHDTADTTIYGTFLSHRVTREEKEVGILSTMESFCPVNDDKVELIKVTITNCSEEPMQITFTTDMPIYGRSAENLRDHNHWTSLLHRLSLCDYGVVVKPVLHHDERGHKPNNSSYFVLASDADGNSPIGQFPTVSEFIGEGGSFDWPKAVVQNIPPYEVPPNRRDGMEAIGAMRFRQVEIKPRQSMEYIIIEGVTEEETSILRCVERYGTSEKFNRELQKNHEYWEELVSRITLETGDNHFDRWMHWISLQPILRKIYGNSFMIYFDYGKGGRGWRDLWQDCLALLLQNPTEIRKDLIANFGGVRLDGSNATIINKELGSFAADRNKISRVWMDHGIWPYYTVKLYVDQTGDMDILFERQQYWKDHQLCRAKAVDSSWSPSCGTVQKDITGATYSGTILEHILVQHLTCFYNVGEHNNIKIEDGDWNDLIDMANEKGESVAFTSFYGWNLTTIAELLLKIQESKGTESIVLYDELITLLDFECNVNLESPSEKNAHLRHYFELINNGFSGKTSGVSIAKLAETLKRLGNWMLHQVGSNEWVKTKDGAEYFNGYYNNNGQRVDGEQEDGPRMNLTAQTFPIMTGAASDEQVLQSYHAAQSILKDPNTGGYRLTTPLGPNTFNFGRGFGVVYGEKETGGMFSHMAVMFANALYKRGYVDQAYEVFSTIYNLANDTEKAKIYPGIPEYISHEGRGMYTYLTGSASWLLMTVVTEMFGIKGEYGDLRLEPKLVPSQFDTDGRAKIKAFFIGRKIELIYSNPKKLACGTYKILSVTINGNCVEYENPTGTYALLYKSRLEQELSQTKVNVIEVLLA